MDYNYYNGTLAPTKQQSKHAVRVHNLPPQPTPFIGRDQEVAEITRLLTDPMCRLLTLVGPGGIGKTRVALAVAAENLDTFTDGLSFVALQPVSSPDFLVSAIADAISLSLSGQQDPNVQLLTYLRDKELLFLLDNFEHLLEGVGLLADILKAAPAVKLLVTSREVLNLQEEWRYPVQGMDFPKDEETENLEAYSAVQLFVERARRVRPDFSLADEQAGVVRICQLVEGMPLALELAASWATTLCCAAIADEIQRNLDFLTTNLRNVPARHRSMQAVFEQSWQLLTEEERDAFKRLSVFRGGFRRQAAMRVAGASLLILSTLVDKSLLRWEPNGRYQIHELLRQYAEERLRESPEEATRIHDIHCAYYADFLCERMEDALGGRQREVNAEIAAELENVRAAWQWAVGQAKVEEIHKAAETLGLFYHFQSRYREGADAFEKAIRSLDRQELVGQTTLALANMLVVQGWFCIRLGQLEQAKAMLERSRALYASLGVPPQPGDATDPLLPLGIIASIEGDYPQAARLGEQARQVSEAQGHKSNLMFSYYVLTGAALAQGQYAAARHYAQHAYAMAEEIRDHWFMAYILNERGNVARALGDYAEAQRHYQASYARREEFDDPEGMAVALNHLGKIAILQADYARARRLYQQSLAIYQEIGDRGGLAAALEGLGTVACAAGEYQAARHHLRQALQIAQEIQFMPLMFSILMSISELLLHTGCQEQGIELLALTQYHPASDHEGKERAQHLLARYGAELPPDIFTAAIQRGQASDLDTVIATLQVALLAPEEHTDTVPTPISGHAHEPDESLIEPLTERELEVLHLVAAGLSNREIAHELFIEPGTVKTHVHNICSKLGARSRTHAVARAWELRLV